MTDRDTITLPREVVEKAVKAFENGCPPTCENGMIDSGGFLPWGEPMLDLCPACLAFEHLRTALAAEPTKQKFDHSIGAERFKVVRGTFWWHVKIGDSPTEHGKFRSSEAAQKMADDLLREFRNGAFVQNALAAEQPKPSEDVEALRRDAERYRWLRDWLDNNGLLVRAIRGESLAGYEHPDIEALRRENERLREALESIAANACCDRCQEAALVAKAALRREDV